MARGAHLRLLLDEMYPPLFARALRDRGHDAAAVVSHGALAGGSDAALLALATSERRVLVTENARDLVALATALAQRGRSHAGIVLVNARRFPRRLDAAASFATAFDHLAAELPGGLAGVVVWLRFPKGA